MNITDRFGLTPMNRRPTCPARRRGGALVPAMVIVAVLATLATSALVVNVASKKEVAAVGNLTRAMYMAETGVSECLVQVATAVTGGGSVPVTVGTEANPMLWEGGRYWCSIAPEVDGSFTVVATGSSNLARRSIRAVISEVDGIYDHAIFAGNSEGDPTYTLPLSGNGVRADSVTGDVYSAVDVDVSGDATVTGEVSAGGQITGTTGVENVYRRLPDVRSMDYENNNDVDVAALFSAATPQANALGGTALELPESSPAHIFRKDPDDRTTETSGTVKSDYFLEDPYEAVTDFVVPETGRNGHTISLSGTMGKPGVSGTDKVYFIDGNLWVHNKPFGRLRLFNSDPEGAKITFVVKGNVYFSDDVYIEDPAKDGIAFIAIKDDTVDDSGNIYLGDPRYGTLDQMEAYMYAEDTFFDNNLSASGSSEVTVVGNMTAGNKVSINRDFVRPDGSVAHSKLTVDFDDRISTGALALPGLPSPANTVEGFTVVYWREIAVQ